MATKKQKQTRIIIGLVLLVVIVGFSQTLSLTTTELSWIPLTEQSNSFTNLNIEGIFGMSCNAYLGDRVTSKYWDMIIRDVRSSCNIAYFDASSFSGGDGNLILTTSSSRVQPSGSVSAKFNENLFKQHFRINYKVSGCGMGCTFKSFGETVSTGAGSGVIELKTSILNDCSELIINGKKIRDICSSPINPDFSLTVASSNFDTSATLTLSNPRFRPKFDCTIDNDEVLIFDEFTEGSNFNINDLSNDVKKFCLNQPPTIRSFTEQGIAIDESGEILIALRDGESITVKSGQTIRVPYITQEQTGLLRCGVDEAYNTKTEQCENILSEGVVEDGFGIIVESISIGADEILYSQDKNSNAFNIGDFSIQPSEPKFVCLCDRSYLPPEPSNDCWESNINGKIVKYGEVVKLSDYISYEYKIFGNAVTRSLGCTYDEDAEWINSLKFMVDMDGLQIIKDEEIRNILLDSSETLSISIDNKIGQFESSGLQIRITKKLVDEVVIRNIDLTISKGLKNYDINLPSESLGEISLEIVPFLQINNNKFFSNEKLIIDYNVAETTQDLEDLDREGKEPGIIIEPTTKTNLALVIGGFIVIVGGLSFLAFRIRKIKR